MVPTSNNKSSKSESQDQVKLLQEQNIILTQKITSIIDGMDSFIRFVSSTFYSFENYIYSVIYKKNQKPIQSKIKGIYKIITPITPHSDTSNWKHKNGEINNKYQQKQVHNEYKRTKINKKTKK